MVLTEVECSLDTDHGITGQHAMHHSLTKTLFNSRNVLTRHNAANNSIHELKVYAFICGFKANVDNTKLTAAAGLLLMLTFGFRHGANGLTIRNSLLGQSSFHIELVLQLTTDNVQMLFTQTAEQHITRLDVLFDGDGGIFFTDTIQAGDDFIILSLLFGIDGHADAGGREHDGLNLDDIALIAESIIGRSILQLGQGTDVACIELVNRNGLLATHENRGGGFFCLFDIHIIGSNRDVQRPPHDLNDGILTKLVVDGLGHMAHHFAITGQLNGRTFTVGSFRKLCFCSRGKVMHDIIGQSLNACIVKSRHAHNRSNGTFLHALAQTIQNIFLGELHLFEELLHKSLVCFGSSLGKLFVKLLYFTLQIAGNSDLFQTLGTEFVGHGVNDIHKAYKITALHDGELNRNHRGTELFVYVSHDLLEVGVFTVHLVDDHDMGLVLFMAHGHSLFCTHHGAGNGAHHDDSAVAEEHGGSYIAIEIVTTRSIDKVDLGVFPLDRKHAHVDGAAALDLFRIKVGSGGSVFNLADTIQKSGIKKHGLCQSGLALASMAENAYVADGICGIVFHSCSPCRIILLHIQMGERRFLPIHSHVKHLASYHKFPMLSNRIARSMEKTVFPLRENDHLLSLR